VPLPTYPFQRQRYWVARRVEAATATLQWVLPGSDEPSVAHAAPDNHVAPRDELELFVADLWRQHLGIERIGIDDDFFALGGNSMIATQIVTRFKDALQVDLKLQQFMQNSTIRALTAALEAAEAPAVAAQ
ncbi:phosphopantetheine-binding protein, partial [Chitinolyticbacter albus]|uniref:phosphopantetheine-binding protein n=1 Tax=Chitinolyticbacter albus TaxID=2961951 RepID=UPI00210EABA8